MAQGIMQMAQQRPDPLLEAFGQGGLGSSPVANVAVVGLMALVAEHVLSLLARLADALVRDAAAPLGWLVGGARARCLGHAGPWPGLWAGRGGRRRGRGRRQGGGR
jgi:hypothetical protein